MNKRELIEKIHYRADNCSKLETEVILNAFVSIVKDTLIKGGKVTITGFGTFFVKIRKKRKGVNPQTGEKIKIPEIRVAKFKTGSALKRAVK